MSDINATYVILGKQLTYLNRPFKRNFRVESATPAIIEITSGYPTQGNGFYAVYKTDGTCTEFKRSSSQDKVNGKAVAKSAHNFHFTSGGDYTLEINQTGGTEQYPIITESLKIFSVSTDRSEGLERDQI